MKSHKQISTERERQARNSAFATALRLVRTLIGFTVLGVGVLLIVLPGPAFIVIPIGLAILATEYAWARRYLRRFKEGGEKLGAIFFRKREEKSTSAGPEPQRPD
ncbi:PGPGW domain-containing protein [bacterium]|nr:PGPGW domain-containing protein [bacterium]